MTIKKALRTAGADLIPAAAIWSQQHQSSAGVVPLWFGAIDTRWHRAVGEDKACGTAAVRSPRQLHGARGRPQSLGRSPPTLLLSNCSHWWLRFSALSLQINFRTNSLEFERVDIYVSFDFYPHHPPVGFDRLGKCRSIFVQIRRRSNWSRKTSRPLEANSRSKRSPRSTL